MRQKTVLASSGITPGLKVTKAFFPPQNKIATKDKKKRHLKSSQLNAENNVIELALLYQDCIFFIKVLYIHYPNN